MKDNKRFYALDSFRGVCALFVVAFHTHISGAFTEFGFFRRADIFVEFFFVLSGFVLAHAYGKKKDVRFMDFFISRTFRLIPLHWFMLFILIVLELGKYIANQKGLSFVHEPFTGMYDPSGIIPNLLLVQSWTKFTEMFSFNYPSWSISIEYYMYMIFMVVLIFGDKLRVLAWWSISLIAFFLLFLGVGFLTEASLRGLSCFFAGSLSHIAYSKLSNRIRVDYKYFTALEALLIFLVFAVVLSDFEYQKIISSVLFCCVVVVFAFDRGAVSKLFGCGVFLLIGRLSYSIYLTHAAILICVMYLFLALQKVFGVNLTPLVGGVRHIQTGSDALNNMIAACLFLLVIAVSAFTYKHVEVKGQMLGRRVIQAWNVSRQRRQPGYIGQ
ncbi:acyltransferase family protein [Pseudomonas sp. ES3-33]|uniref:acyltransferase family protein n=1 Tax=Pseudomonas sp. ES3-33 TaxID=1628833 RepID=UPI0005D35E51|nr:acyltransferase [Pseudomonas sp. ES3-33]KJH75363.1 hypothetical protein UB23_19470 [Pseudomonas sp. ES3-33]